MTPGFRMVGLPHNQWWVAQLAEQGTVNPWVAGSSPAPPASGMWHSLASAPGLGPGGRRFKSCHPDDKMKVMSPPDDSIKHSGSAFG